MKFDRDVYVILDEKGHHILAPYVTKNGLVVRGIYSSKETATFDLRKVTVDKETNYFRVVKLTNVEVK